MEGLVLDPTERRSTWRRQDLLKSPMEELSKRPLQRTKSHKSLPVSSGSLRGLRGRVPAALPLVLGRPVRRRGMVTRQRLNSGLGEWLRRSKGFGRCLGVSGEPQSVLHLLELSKSLTSFAFLSASAFDLAL